MMDTNPDWYAGGLSDRRPVKGTKYSIKLNNSRPILARQYHLTWEEQEFAATWVPQLLEASLASQGNTASVCSSRGSGTEEERYG